VIEIRRDDGELCGYVRALGDRWQALVVFGAVLGDHASEDAATQQVRDSGIAVLQDRWTLAGTGDDDGIVCIQEARPDGVRVALGYYSLPGVPSRWVERVDIDAGTVTLRHGSDEPTGLGR
jgi:hypothetical protein